MAQGRETDHELLHLLRPAARRLLCACAARSAARWATAGGLAAVAVAAVASARGVGAWRWLPLAVLMAAGAIGAMVRLARGITLAGAAAWLDRTADLHELLATAEELARRPGAGEPLDRVVCAEAAEKLRRSDPQPSPWTGMHRVAGSLVLTAALCGTMLLLPVPGTRRSPWRPAEANRNHMARAAIGGGEGAIGHWLGPGEAPPDDASRVQLGETLPASQDGRGSQPSGDFRNDAENIAAARRHASGREDAHARRRTVDDGDVWVTVRSGAEIGAEGGAYPLNRGWVSDSAADAWSVARRRAGDAIRRGDLPGRYRPLIRAYFDTDGAGSQPF